ncbi:MAG: ABC transporter ATP-binding protein [Phycisphaerae bacterium]|nr:ABC transporter ATP-binding protein [Phycisphaerae bacterium]
MTPDAPASGGAASSASDDAVIVVEDLIKKFGSQTVLSGVNLRVRRGETLVIMGGSGCGKSTLLRLLIGSIQPTAGRIQLFGEDLSVLDETGLDAIRQRFGILFQSGALFQSMTLAENVALPLEEHTELDRSIIDIQVKIKLELVGLREHAQKLPSQISGGMKKRAGLARALSLDPTILFYDEPSAGLDPVTSAEIDQLIVDLTRKLGVTSVVVTHEMDSAFTIADRMVMLDKGRVLKIGTRDEFDAIRRMGDEESKSLDEQGQIIRQFLRGDPIGPITQRREALGFADDLLGSA